MPHSWQVTERTLYVFAKEPRPGFVKTRLCPPLSPSEAADCHRAFLTDTLATQVQARGVRVVLAATPDGDCPWLREVAARFSVECVAQGRGHLGDRMRNALARGCRRGGSAVVIGSDTPDLPVSRVGEAFAALQSHGVVVGPSLDGGYYLIGCRAQVPPIFELDCAWGEPGVMQETRVRLQSSKHDFAELETWRDIDTFDDLRSLVAFTHGDSNEARGLPATSALFAAWSTRGTPALG